MNRTRLAKALLAALLVVMLPLEQVHCACPQLGKPMRSTSAAPSMAMPACPSSCCAARAAGATSTPPHAPKGCPCEKMTTTELPVVLAVAAIDSPAPFLTPLPVQDPIAPAAATFLAGPALDIGSPPHPVDPGAHGLRAPPVLA